MALHPNKAQPENYHDPLAIAATRDDPTDVLRQAIVRGDYGPNERLLEQEIMTRFGLPRSKVRVALRELSQEGLVELELNRGARVRTVSIDEAIILTEVRMVLEGLCAAKAAQNATDEELEGLSQTFELLREYGEATDFIRFAQMNTVLHNSIGAMSRQPVATKFIERLGNQGIRPRFLISLLPGRIPTSIAEHAAIVNAILERNAVEARDAMEAHVASIIDALKSIENLRGYDALVLP